MAIDVITLGAARKYTDQTVVGLGALKGAAATIKNITHQDGINRVTFEWTGLDGTKMQQIMEVYDGTPIYVWESGNTYDYGDLVIYESAFYRCITENSDVIFDNTKYNEIGSPDGNYDIVADSSLLPNRFTAADRKMYYSIDDEAFWLWNGQEWILQFDKEILNTLQPKTMSAAVSVGGVSQSTVENAIGAMATKISKNDFDIHRNLGTEITAAQKLAIANGTFEDLPIGAYWTLNNTIYRIAHYDYYLGTGDTECTSHHIVVVPDNAIYSAKMNDTGTTTGGYAGSKMRTTNLATALSTFETDFGAAHILNHRILITNAVTNGQASGWTWVDSKVDLMSENMIYGHTAWGQTGFEIGVEKGQLMLFSLYPEFIHERAHQCWLRSIASESGVCYVSDYGDASNGNASRVAGVRPYACIYFDDVLT